MNLTKVTSCIQMMPSPTFSPTDTCRALTSHEHEGFIQELRMYRNEPDMCTRMEDHIQTQDNNEMKIYGDRQQCVASPLSQRADNEVKVEPAQSPSPHEAVEETFVKHRVRKWFRAVFKWCAQVFSFGCQRQNEQFARVEVARGTVGLDPTQHARSVLSTRASDDSIVIGVQIPTQGGLVFKSTRTSTSATQPHYKHRPTGKNKRATRKRSGGDKFAGTMKFYGVVVDSSLEQSLSEDDNDDWNMRNARRAASEIEWYDATWKSSISCASTTTPTKNRGAWSADEHERFCEGVKLFPYGSWKRIAAHVGTRAVQQVMSHAQSVRAKKKRIQEREKRRTTESTALRNSAKSHSPKNQNARTSTRQMPTPEELLLASMRTPLSAHANPLQTRPVAVIESDYSDVASVNIDPNQLEISGVSNYAVGHPFPPVEKDAAKSGDGDFHRVLQAQKCRLCPDLMLDSDIPLLNDDGIAGLIDILPNQNQTPM